MMFHVLRSRAIPSIDRFQGHSESLSSTAGTQGSSSIIIGIGLGARVRAPFYPGMLLLYPPLFSTAPSFTPSHPGCRIYSILIEFQFSISLLIEFNEKVSMKRYSAIPHSLTFHPCIPGKLPSWHYSAPCSCCWCCLFSCRLSAAWLALDGAVQATKRPSEPLKHHWAKSMLKHLPKS